MGKRRNYSSNDAGSMPRRHFQNISEYSLLVYVHQTPKTSLGGGIPDRRLYPGLTPMDVSTPKAVSSPGSQTRVHVLKGHAAQRGLIHDPYVPPLLVRQRY